VLASEFCGTSISSHGRPQRAWDAARASNPHLLHARSDQRGHAVFDIDERQLQARLLAVDDPLDPASAVHEQARFVVDARRPGPQPA
jgi:alkaline phosphatase D